MKNFIVWIKLVQPRQVEQVSDLAIAKEIILAHQGTIRAASKNNEIQMIVTLPLATNTNMKKLRKSVNLKKEGQYEWKRYF